jgi:hypothetical protein
MTDRQERIARNEVLFREVNERIREVPLDTRSDDMSGFLCECGDANCTDTILLTIAEYEQVRADPATFFVVPGHVAPDVEDVVAEGDRYTVVRKHPTEAQVAIENDPRGAT